MFKSRLTLGDVVEVVEKYSEDREGEADNNKGEVIEIWVIDDADLLKEVRYKAKIKTIDGIKEYARYQLRTFTDKQIEMEIHDEVFKVLDRIYKGINQGEARIFEIELYVFLMSILEDITDNYDISKDIPAGAISINDIVVVINEESHRRGQEGTVERAKVIEGSNFSEVWVKFATDGSIEVFRNNELERIIYNAINNQIERYLEEVARELVAFLVSDKDEEYKEQQSKRIKSELQEFTRFVIDRKHLIHSV